MTVFQLYRYNTANAIYQYFYWKRLHARKKKDVKNYKNVY